MKAIKGALWVCWLRSHAVRSELVVHVPPAPSGQCTGDRVSNTDHRALCNECPPATSTITHSGHVVAMIDL